VNSVIGALRISLGLDSAAFEGGLTAAQRTMKRFERDMNKLATNLQGLGGMLTLGVTAPLAAVGGAMAKLSIDAEEMGSAFAVSFGKMAKETEAWAATTGDALGRSTQEMQKGALAFNGLFKAGGPATEQAAAMSKQFAILAQDLSSFFNVSPDEALQSLISGLSGEAEPLRKFNVFLTESAVRLKAVEMGLGTMKGELSESAKIQARAALIMKATTEAQGDVARTAGSTANQIRRLQSEWQELAVTMGNVLTPLIRPIVTGLADMVKGFGALSPAMQKVILIGAGVAAAIGPILIGAGALAGAIGTLAPIIGGLGVALGGALLPILAPVAIGVGAVAAAFLLFGDKIVPALKQFQAQATATLGPTFAAMMETGRGLVDAFSAAVVQLSDGPAGDAIEKLIDLIGDLSVAFTTGLGANVVSAMNGILNIVNVTMTALTGVINVVSALLRGDWSAAWWSYHDAMAGALNGVSRAFASFANIIPAQVRGVFASVKYWLQDRLGPVFDYWLKYMKALGDAFSWLEQKIFGKRPASAAAAPALPTIAPPPPPAPRAPPAPAAATLPPTANLAGVGRAAAAATKPVDELGDALKKLQETLMTPNEKATRDRAAEIKILEDAYDKGRLSAEGLLKAKQALDFQDFRDAFPSTVKAAPDQNPQLVDANLPTATFGGAIMSEEAAKALREQMAGTFRGALDSLKNGGTKGLFQWMADQLSERLMDRLADILTSFVDQLLKSQGGNVGSALASIFGSSGSTPGFATGGSFTVGGSGGIDSQLVKFRATPGEMVNIRHGNDNGGGGSVVFDLRGAVMTADLLNQMNAISARTGGQVYGQIKSEQARAAKAQQYRVAR
jgi:hypothetical protein